jgi:hypothetical protein
MRFSCMFEILMVIACPCGLLHVHVGYCMCMLHIYGLKNILRMHAEVKNINCPISCIIRFKHGNPIVYKKYRI